MGEGKPVSKRGWLILGVILLSLWLAPAFFAFFKSYSFSFGQNKTDYTQAWKEYQAWVEWNKYVADVNERVRRSQYGRGSSHDGESREVEPEIVYVDRPIVTERIVERDRPSYQSQPDLSGFYWQRNFGTIQYVYGPF